MIRLIVNLLQFVFSGTTVGLTNKATAAKLNYYALSLYLRLMRLIRILQRY